MKKCILALALVASSALANGRDSGISYCVNLGTNGTTTNTALVDANKYCITQFPEWSYGKVKLNLNALNGSFTGSVVINGQVYHVDQAWFQSFELPQSSGEPVSVIVDNDNATPAQVGLQWWVEQ